MDQILKLLPAVCDRLSLTVDIPAAEQQELGKWIRSMHPTSKFGQYQVAGLVSGDDISYTYGTTSPGGQFALLQAAPKNVLGKMRFLRAEMNPSRIDLQTIEATINQFRPWLYETLTGEGTVTSFHLAVDVSHVDIDTLLFRAPKFSVSAMNQKSGKTLYIGSRRYRIYEKREEIIANNKKKAKEAAIAVPENPLVRIEIDLYLPSKTRLQDIPELPNQLAELTVTNYADLVDGDDKWRLFLHAARLGGAQAALAKIKSKKLKAEYVSRLKSGSCNWWQPEKVWAQLPTIIDGILEPDKYPPNPAADYPQS